MPTIFSEIERYKPALAIERYFSRRTRRWVNVVLAVAFVIVSALLGYSVFLDSSLRTFSSLTNISGTTAQYAGVLVIILSVFVTLRLLAYFYNSLYFSGIESILHEDEKLTGGITYEVASMIAESEGDLTYGYLTSGAGMHIMRRCGIKNEALTQYFSGSRTPLAIEGLTIPEGGFLTIEHVGHYVFAQDKSLSEFLFSHGVSEDIYKGAVAWVARMYLEAKAAERWWSRDNLGKINGVGKDFSYGVAYELQKYIRSLRNSAVYSSLASDVAYADEKIIQIETILARAKEANVLVVGEAGAGTMDVLVRLNQKIHQGKSVASVEGKHFMVFDWEGFVAGHSTKQEFEPAFMKMFSQAEQAGNIIIVIENVAKFFASAEALGVDVGDVIDRFLTSPQLQVVATSDPSLYHQSIENKPQFSGRFEVVYIESPSLSGVIRILEDVALTYEFKNGITFTYPAIVAIAESADRYIVEGVMPDKAVDLLVEVAPAAKQQNIEVITKEFVEAYVTTKTGIPTGPVTGKERDMLMNLEAVLHAKVIGQDSAIDAISNAMRRARAGVQSKDRPMGSFLFLGSTGVGKTETAKALAAVFFGDEEKMSRIDMSEFSGADGLARMMGEGTTPGVLSSMLREHPYGVVLLDEFEKTSKDVHNLFLQVLDEGVFTDGRGEKVNARNSIIIATSNAGSKLIWEMVGRGENPADKKDAIINAIVGEGLYAPELVNRFDDVIIFEPLNEENQKQIAHLMLEELKARVKEKGYTLEINDALMNGLIARGYNPQFGARPMRRLIQDLVEGKIAEKIIAGSLAQGGVVSFTPEDFAEVATH